MALAVTSHEFDARVLKALGLDKHRCREVEIRLAVDSVATVKALCYVTDEQGKALAEELEWREFMVCGPRGDETRWRIREIVSRKDRTWAGWFRWVFGLVRY